MATISTINVGSIANDGTGDERRTAFQKCNANFGALNTDLVAAEADITTLQGDVTTLQSDVTTLTSGKQAADPDLTAISALSANGFLVRTSSGTYSLRSVTVTSGELTVSNGDGVSGDPTLGLATSGVSAGSYARANITVDNKGRVTSAADGSNSFTGDVSATGDLTLTDTGAGASAGPTLILDRDSTSPAIDDEMGEVIHRGENDAGDDVDYVRVFSYIKDGTDTDESGGLRFSPIRNGSAPTIPLVDMSGQVEITGFSTTPLEVDRQSSDGGLVNFKNNGTTEGIISVSGNTVTYGGFTGSHYAEWQDESLIASPPPRGTWIETTDEEFQIPGPDLNHDGLCKVRIAQPGSKRVAGVYMDDLWSGEQRVGILIAAVGGPFMCRCKGPLEGGEFVEIVEPGVAGAQNGGIRQVTTAGKVWRADGRDDERPVSITFEGAG